ncbi:hypothetical protein FBUS_01962 [Fasciolopsis buskii]|uniref:Uncharacterized protein n=1 Tax=Fasciolopsis buskii TaxID=27845 RepID=A0A8E0RMI2_9TREM|nr:hypothetical protein FBUS_01962 [Fasciolopsis buski]
MSSYSSFVDTLADIINKETASALLNWRTSDHVPASEPEGERMQNFSLLQFVDVILDQTKKWNIVSPLSYTFDFLVMMVSCMHWKTSERDKRLLTSFVLRDLEQAVRAVRQRCVERLEQRFCYSTIRLGHIYAWARDSSSLGENSESTRDAKQLKRRIRNKLSRLVLLCRAGKRLVRSHPVLASMRHELLRIRTQLTGWVRTAAMGPTNPALSQLSDWEDNTDEVLRRFVPSHLCSAFCQLIDQLTDLLLELPTQVPGISVPATRSPSELDRRSHWHSVVVQTVLHFYNNHDSWAGIDLQLEDPVGELLTPEKALALVTCSSDDSDSNDEGNQPKSTTQSDGHKVVKTIDPSIVQAILDRFDHQNRGNTRKRHFSGTDDQFDEESQPAPKLTKSTNNNNLVSLDDSLERIPSVVGSQMESKRSDRSPECSVPVDHHDADFPGSPDSKETTSVSHLNTSTTTEQSTPPQFVDTSLVCLSATKEVPESTEAESQLPGTKTRRSNRSLRTRRSRTPSEASYSEGEVLSDSEEDRDGTSSVGEANELVPELLGEKTNAEGQDDERAAEIIQLVHNRMRDATPVSDIDLTELEIMDEWATPATTVVTTNNKRADTDSQETTEQDPPNETNGEQCEIVEQMNERLSEMISQVVTSCGQDLDRLLTHGDQPENSNVQLSDSTESSQLTSAIQLPAEIEASIERTTSAFKEHVTSVLANLLHAVPNPADPNGTPVIVRPQPVVCGRRGARLLGMLKSYQQDVAKRMSSANAV